MNIKDLLLNGSSFLLLLKQHAIDIADIQIKDEEVLEAQFFKHPELSKESICIEGKNVNGTINFFGILHFNLLSKLAVFEMLDYEKIAQQELN